jgi:aminoglycoside N3'-acetyltransferase
MSSSPLTRSQFAQVVRSLGVRAGDLMIAHSSFRSFGPDRPPDQRVEGGPEAIAWGLIDAVSPGGSVFVPTFNYGNDPWQPETSPSHDGIITEVFRKHPGVIRSNHPTHALAGSGPVAEEILRGHDRVHAFAADSPCWRLWERNAWVLLIGVSHESNSVAHVAEERLKMPYLDRRRAANVVQADGSIEQIILRRPGCSDAWAGVLDPPLRAMGAVRHAMAGESNLMLMRARDVVSATIGLLEKNPAALLCQRPGCEACQSARSMLRDDSPT